MLSKAKITEAISNRKTIVELKSLGETACIRVPNAAEVRKLFSEFKRLPSEEKAKRTNQLLLQCFVGEDGEPIFESIAEVDSLPVPIHQDMQTVLMDALGFGVKEEEGN